MSQEIDARCNKVIQAGLVHGARTLLSGEKVTQRTDDILCLAAATGLVTTIAVLQCVEDGILSLTDDILDLAPELKDKQVITGHSKFADGQKPTMEPLRGPITLQMLLTHSSGVVFDVLNEHIDLEDTYTYPLGFQPGQGWMWGPGMDWAGRIVERLTSQTLGDFVQERIFTPLGITDAEFYPVRRQDLQQRQVDRHPEDPEGYGKAALGGDGNKGTKGDFGSQGLFMTAPDFVKLLLSLLANDGKLLKRATVDDMFRDHLSVESAMELDKTLAGPLGGFFRPDPESESGTGHGLGGLVTLEDVENGYGAGTLTWPGAMPLLWFIDRKNDLCGFGSVQATLGPGGTSKVPGLKIAFRKGVYAEYATWKKEKSQA
ncbi:Beta-lactamase/transpeptidase-like protein [Akanthomyces lecanii RCEF 1005]|uniref:Beta-lactamase/transpeptidase-like protein n=1 Tax=Akanthomyces lecanii RCEF 1005 TaxID=1081108 RepID=A0A168JZS0_CORDF|nr:Beta-lactamase/transpeptidase-like protein [Akanthomyces lecanii RCEF 1005]